VKRKICALISLVLLTGVSFAQKPEGAPTLEERIAKKDLLRSTLNMPPVNRMSVAPLAGQALLTWDNISSFAAGVYTTTIGATVIGYEGLTSSSWWDYESKALFVFDVSALGSGNYSFAVDGEQLSGVAKTCTIYDADDFGLQKIGPYTTADVDAAFLGMGTPIETVDFPTIGTLEFPGVSPNVNADLGGLTGFILDIDQPNGPFYPWFMSGARLEAAAGVPTMGTYGLIGFIGLIAVIGIVMIRNKK